MHLQNKHPIELAQLENSPQKESTGPKESKNGIKMKAFNIVATNDDPVTHINVDQTNEDIFETEVHMENTEIDQIDSSHMNVVAPNKSNVEIIMPSIDQTCTIEVSFHVFPIGVYCS